MGLGIKLFILLLVTSPGTLGVLGSSDGQVVDGRRSEATFENLRDNEKVGLRDDVLLATAEEEDVQWRYAGYERRGENCLERDVEDNPAAYLVADIDLPEKESVREEGQDAEALEELRRFPAVVSVKSESAAERYSSGLMSGSGLTVSAIIWVTCVSFVTLGSASLIMLAVNSLLFERLPGELRGSEAGNPGDAVEYTALLDEKVENKENEAASISNDVGDSLPPATDIAKDGECVKEKGVGTPTQSESVLSPTPNDDSSSKERKEHEDEDEDDASKAKVSIPSDDH